MTTASAQKSEQPARYKVGPVQSQTYSAAQRSGHGFVLTDGRGSPIASFTYPTSAEAEGARQAMQQATQNAVDIMGYR
jgi:hypothetical protein